MGPPAQTHGRGGDGIPARLILNLGIPKELQRLLVEVKGILIPNLEESWSFSPRTAEPQLRFDALKTQTVLAELGLRGPRC